MSVLHKSVINFCLKHGIEYEFETETEVEFIAPKGTCFSTESRFRVVDLYDSECKKLKAKRVIDLIFLYN